MIGLFTRYGLRDVAKQQGLLALGADDDEELARLIAELGLDLPEVEDGGADDALLPRNDDKDWDW